MYKISTQISCRPRACMRQFILVMKLTAVLMIAAILQVSASATLAQKLTLKKNGITLSQVFKEIRQQTGYNVLWDPGLLKASEKINADFKDTPLGQVMDACLSGKQLTYAIDEQTIIVKAKEVSLPSTLAAISITGKVLDDKNNPLPGVTVTVEETGRATITNQDGDYSIAADNNQTLVFTFVGFKRKEMPIKGQATINITMEQDLGKLDEVQVIAYGTTSRRLSIGNISSVKAADIEKQPVQNPLLTLQGRVPGLEITQLSGMNGAGVTVRIQGRNSIQSGLDPLVVIDGVPFQTQLTNTGFEQIVQGGSPLNYVNPNDIESIDVLKDADATAIYGSRAANGAILITTKKGKAGPAKISFNVQQGWGKVTRKLNLLNTHQYLDMRYEALKNDGININTVSPTNGRYSDLKLWDTTRYTDWQKKLIGGTAQYSNVNLGISGGTTLLQYMVSGTYNRKTTVFPGDFDDKDGGLHFSLNGASANQKLHFSFSGSYTYDQNHLPSVDLTNQIFLAPDAPPLYNADGTLNWATNAAGSSSWTNPLANLSSEFNNTTKNLVSNASLGYNLLPGLDIRSNFGYTDLRSDLYLPQPLEASKPENRRFLQRNSNFANRNMSSWIIEPQLQYAGRVGKGKIDALLGATISQNTSDVLAFSASGFSSDLLMRSPVAATSITVFNSALTMSKYNALFSRLGYNWDDKYLVNFTARRDGSSKFGDDNKLHNFGSAGAAWIFSQEAFIKQNIPFLSFGKLRASYGTTGNDQINDYSYLSLYYSTNAAIPYQNSTGLSANNIPNPHLQWEETRKLQGGIDLGFINDRIIINATYARNRSSNQLISYALPDVTGFPAITENLPATIQNTSWEFVLSTINVKGKDFNWSSSINLTIPRNKLLSFPGIENTSYADGTQGVIVGQPLGVMKVFRYAGVDPATGNYLVLDKNGKPTDNPDDPGDRTALITPMTKYYGGFQNSIGYKGFQLDFLFQFVRQIAARDLYYSNGSGNPGYFNQRYANQPVTVLNHWQKPGDNVPVGRYTVTNFGVPIWPPFSDAGYNYDASFIRLKNLSLSWQLPSAWQQKAHLQNARIYFSGQNLATFTKYTGLDPETRSSSTLPPLQLWTIGFKTDL